MTTFPPDVLEAPPRDRFHRAAMLGSVAVVAAGSAAQLVNYGFGLGMAVLDSLEDAGAFGAVGDVAACAAAAASWLVLIRVRPVRPSAVVLPPVLVFLALDKVVRLHDHIPHYMAFYAPLLAVAAVCIVDQLRRMPRRYARTVAVGLVLLAFSFVLHAVGERVLLQLDLVNNGWARQIKGVVKHGSEVQGWFLIAIGLAFHAWDGRRNAVRLGSGGGQ